MVAVCVGAVWRCVDPCGAVAINMSGKGRGTRRLGAVFVIRGTLPGMLFLVLRECVHFLNPSAHLVVGLGTNMIGGHWYMCKCGKLWWHVVCRFSDFKLHLLFGHPLFGQPLFAGGNIWRPLQISLWEDPFVPGVPEATFGIVELPCSQFLCNKSEYTMTFFWWHFL